MPKKIFKNNLIKVSTSKIREIGKVVQISQSSFEKLLSVKNLQSFTVVSCLVCLAVVGISYNALPQKIPLFYSRPWGEEQLTEKYFLFIIPSFLIIFSLLNNILGKTVIKRWGVFLSLMLAFISFFLCLVGLIGVVKIVFLII